MLPPDFSQMTQSDKIDALLLFNIRAFDHLKGGKVQQLQEWVKVINREKEELKSENLRLKAELTAERKRLTFAKSTADKQRDRITELMNHISRNKTPYKKSPK